MQKLTNEQIDDLFAAAVCILSALYILWHIVISVIK